MIPFTGHSQRRALLVIDLLPISGQVVSLAFGGPQGIFVVGYWLHSGRRKCSRSQVSKATVRSRGVIVGPPRIELYFSILDRPEQLQVQAFVAQARIEALNEAVLHRLSWPNVVPSGLGVNVPTGRRPVNRTLGHCHR